MEAVTHWAIDHTILAQDLLSYRKEVADGEASNNVVHRIAHDVGCGVPDAVANAHETYRHSLARFALACDDVVAAQFGEDVDRYIQALKDFTAGLLEWTTRSARYTRDPSTEWSGHATIV